MSMLCLVTQVAEKKLWDWTKLIEDKNFKRIRLSENKDIWPAFKKLFGGRQDG